MVTIDGLLACVELAITSRCLAGSICVRVSSPSCLPVTTDLHNDKHDLVKEVLSQCSQPSDRFRPVTKQVPNRSAITLASFQSRPSFVRIHELKVRQPVRHRSRRPTDEPRQLQNRRMTVTHRPFFQIQVKAKHKLIKPPTRTSRHR